MENFLKDFNFNIERTSTKPFTNQSFEALSTLCQDGTVPMCRDSKGKLWAIAGHSHHALLYPGHIGVFCGDSIDNLTELYQVSLNFSLGTAGYAFSGIPYPEGVKSRGSIWPFGLYICPVTNRFFCFFHNETGWCAKGTGYDAFSLCETPVYDTDFRHIGLMHSDDQGLTWTFDRWVLTGEKVCFTEKFNPENNVVIGQKSGMISLGGGDFTMFTEPDGDYIYIFYTMVTSNMENGYWHKCDTFVARTRKRTDGVMGDFVKYYDGSFCEPGNLGKESPIVENTWHLRPVYFKKYNMYVAVSSPAHIDTACGIKDSMDIRTSTDMINWSKPLSVTLEGKPFGAHYMSIVSNSGKGYPFEIEGDDFSFLLTQKGQILRHKTKIQNLIKK